MAGREKKEPVMDEEVKKPVLDTIPDNKDHLAAHPKSDIIGEKVHEEPHALGEKTNTDCPRSSGATEEAAKWLTIETDVPPIETENTPVELDPIKEEAATVTKCPTFNPEYEEKGKNSD